MMDIDAVLAELKAGNQRYVADARERSLMAETDQRAALVAGQVPMAAVLGCSDSRVVPEYLFDQGLGDLFVTRVGGNIAEMGAIGSLEFAVDALNVPVIVVLGHEGCGTVTAALELSKPSGDLGRLVEMVDLGHLRPLSAEAALTQAVEHNAKTQARRLVEQSHTIRRQVALGQLRVIAAVYELDGGQVRWL